ncbi:MAG: thiamine pyrophosphate-dependent enzyme [Sphaerochaetaceae bacterium]|nr:thiamine pyrophosphate-dependent enzyme [Sphaerochaetaceae bacterium]MDC7237465.1 thiamine pyrophosphate-dependent enzyme [Sphaerochaetaceae bacterium]
MQLTKKKALKALEIMLNSRYFEQQISNLFQQKIMHGTTHLNIGQEAPQAALALNLDPGDWIVPTHRCHGYTIASGSSMYKMFSEMFGSSHGLSKGLGGSMHMSDLENNNPGSSAVVASGVGLAAGIAFAIKRKKKSNMAVALLGDGATSRGIIHEIMNISSIWDLPLLFYLENNGYGMSANVNDMVATKNLVDRAKVYNIKAVSVDGNDLEAVYKAVEAARKYITEEKKPYFIELKTYRFNGHSKSDPCVYRTREEEAYWLQRCPIKNFTKKIIDNKIASAEEVDILNKACEAFVLQEFKKAEAVKDDALELENIEDFVFDPIKVHSTHSTSSHRALGREAIREALLEECLLDENVVLIGEDIAKYGGCFKVTGDLYTHVENQMFETPVSEEGFSSLAVGASLLGIRSVVEIMYGDFSTLISDALINHASKIRFMSGGQFNCPVVFRLPMGCGTGHGAQHSQSLEMMFTNIPGLKVVAPSSPRKAKALLKASIRDNNPVIFLEHKLLYLLEEEVGDETEIMELGKADIIEEGSSISLISYGFSTNVCKKAIELLNSTYKFKNVVELVDINTLSPLDRDTIINSVVKTHKALIVHESPLSAGFGAEIAATICGDQRAFKALEKPIERLGGKNFPIPFSPSLERAVVPTEIEVFVALQKLLDL